MIASVLGYESGAWAEKPLMCDFIGLNVHTVQFKPELYRPVTRLVRDYHELDWDVGEDTSNATTFPLARNGVDWGGMYAAWKAAGYGIDVCVMLGNTKPEAWKDLARDSRAYGLAFADYFGPSGKRKLVESVEIGNEPGNYPDAKYRTLFENMAAGIRAGDPKLKILTCAMKTTPSGQYHKSVTLLDGLEKLYDVINIHSYAEVEGWPTWRRSFPEDPKIAYAKDVQNLIDWRNAHAPGKEVWLTEFGYDSTTKPQEKTGDFSKWVGVTDVQQAQYIVRSFLMFSAMNLSRSYLYWFNDEDKPSVHASSGLTRNYQPKPSYYATAHLLATLGEYRFANIVEQKTGENFIYEYRHGSDPRRRIWVAWSPTGEGRSQELTFKLPAGAKVERAERMPLNGSAVKPVDIRTRSGALTLTVDESPVYVWLTMP